MAPKMAGIGVARRRGTNPRSTRNLVFADQTVTVQISSGLGNQMFQYAAALGLAEHLSANVQLDTSWFSAQTLRQYQLDQLQVPQAISSVRAVRPVRARSLTTRAWQRLTGTRKLANNGCDNGGYREPHHHFDPDFFKLRGADIYIVGYFQSPRYFANCAERLRSEFQPAEPLGAHAQASAKRIAEAGRASVSLHVRRGDYLGTPKSIHALLGDSYYRRALSLMRRLLGTDLKVFLFSDDPDYVQSTFAELPHAHVVRTDPTRSWEDMVLMSRCHHHIIANSSYSWWGAWLNPREDKFVIAPARWFTSDALASRNVLDIYPEDWILLK